MKSNLYIFNEFDSSKECNIAIGNFDGVHKGHQLLIHQMLSDGVKDNQQSIIVTFTPNTKSILSNSFELVQPYVDRRYSLQRQGVCAVLEIDFNIELCKSSPNVFLDELSSKILIANVYVGKDFRFGSKGTGNLDTLKSYFSKERVHCTDLLLQNDSKFSSRTLREVLKAPNLSEFEKLTGYPYVVSGPIVPGKQIGKKIGFPTINIDLNPMSLRYGVYIVKVTIDEDFYQGIANFGVAPTIHTNRPNCLEVHFPNDSKELYGKEARVEFVKFLRAEKHFCDKSDLKLAIQQDLLSFNNYFSA
ncbi:MAG: riboflavin biosynthesis protein RibF [Candidatus Cloacimonetes bacterium]|nr:riboflavin biosynthesis protein RibF [Candidatus Cloacimonadota bacterium]